MSAEGTVDQGMWDELRDAWSAYSDAIEAWIQAATGDAQNDEIDALLHKVIAEHNSWSSALAKVVEATHHH